MVVLQVAQLLCALAKDYKKNLKTRYYYRFRVYTAINIENVEGLVALQ